jgi:uncharacterized protein (UPF0297 family)
MPQNPGETVSFKPSKDGETKVHAILLSVYEALKEKGYNPINQLTRFFLPPSR